MENQEFMALVDAAGPKLKEELSRRGLLPDMEGAVRCDRCGSDKISHPHWYYPNTGEIGDSAASHNYSYCDDCGDDCGTEYHSVPTTPVKKVRGKVVETLTVEKSVEVEVPEDADEEAVEEAIREAAYETTVMDGTGWEGIDTHDVNIERLEDERGEASA